MKKIRYFKCVCSKEIEKLVEDDVKVIECECGEFAMRMLSAPRCFGNTTGRSPAANYKRKA